MQSSKSKISKSIGKSTVQDKQVSSLEEEQLGKRRRPAPGALASRNVTGARERRSEAATLDLLSKEGARGRKRKQPEGVQNDAVEPVTGVPQDRQQKPERVSNRNDAITESKGQQVQGRSIIQRAGRGTSAAPCKNAKTPAKIISSQIHDQHSAPSNTLGSADDLQRQQLVQGTPCRGSKSFQKGQVKGQKKTGTFKDAALRAGQQASSGSGGSRVGARSRPAVARDVLRFGAEEAEKSEQQIAAHPSTTSPSTAGHTKEHMAHAPHSEAVAGKTGKPERSPTPVAAAAVLEMSRPASPVQEPRAEHIPAALDQVSQSKAGTWGSPCQQHWEWDGMHFNVIAGQKYSEPTKQIAHHFRLGPICPLPALVAGQPSAVFCTGVHSIATYPQCLCYAAAGFASDCSESMSAWGLGEQ